MNQFLTRLAVCQLDDGVHWQMLEKLQYDDEVLGLIVVAVDFVTDGGSVPSIFQGFVNPYGKGFKGFAIHDWLYATQTFTREQSDECLRRALGACGENFLDDYVQFEAVRLGGQTAWEEDQVKYSLKKVA